MSNILGTIRIADKFLKKNSKFTCIYFRRLYFCGTFNQEEQKMKKIYFAIAACAMFAFAACNNSTESGNKDSMADTTKKVEEPAPATVDTAAKAADTAAKADMKKEEGKKEEKK